MRQKKLIVILMAAVASLFAVSVAFAAMSTTLNITFGKVTQNALTWNVAFTTGTVTATAAGTSGTGRSCGTATVAATAVTVADTTLSKPGDKCTWKLNVKNTGGIAAKVGTITPTKPTSTTCGTATAGKMVCGNITYLLTTDAAGSTQLTTSNFTVSANSNKDMYLVANYTGTGLNSSAVTQSAAKFSIKFDQA